MDTIHQEVERLLFAVAGYGEEAGCRPGSQRLSSAHLSWFPLGVVDQPPSRWRGVRAGGIPLKSTKEKIAILVANEGVGQVELTSPLDALHSAGADVSLLAEERS